MLLALSLLAAGALTPVRGESPSGPAGAPMYIPAGADTTSAPDSVTTVPASGTSSRRTTAIIYSALIPGTGQTYLGDTYKGAAITLATFASALTAVISYNNFIARGERLDALEYQYKMSTSWTSSDLIYKSMKDSHRLLQQDRKRRNIFLVVTGAIWVANIVDVAINTEDRGEKLFSINTEMPNPPAGTLALLAPQPIFSLSIPLDR